MVKATDIFGIPKDDSIKTLQVGEYFGGEKWQEDT